MFYLRVKIDGEWMYYDYKAFPNSQRDTRWLLNLSQVGEVLQKVYWRGGVTFQEARIEKYE